MSEDSTPDGVVDRRRMLKRAAAAGAVVWTAPLVTSSVASAANNICTAKCAGTPVTCFNYLRTSTTPCSTWVMNSMTLFPNSCPCGGSTIAGCLTWPSSITFSGGGYSSTVAVSAAGAFTLNDLPTSVTVTAGALLTARMYCLDRNGDRVWTTCTYRLSLVREGCERSIAGFGKTCTYPSSNTCGPNDGGCASTSPTVTSCGDNTRSAGGASVTA